MVSGFFLILSRFPMQEYAIIVAGGTGSRMKRDIPKQFIPVNGLPVLMHTIKAFRKYSKDLSIILVLPEDQFQFWTALCHEAVFAEPHTLVAGGNTRFESVKNGLDTIQNDISVVAVHDGVRPVIDTEIIAQAFIGAAQHGTSVTSVLLKDSIRLVKASGENSALDRSSFRLIQTPQTFRFDWMKHAFDQPFQDHFTDCASVLESAGYPIHLIEGSYRNIKITTSEDLNLAEIYLQQI
jgi:2-C-methyl-D-erythritol 4-phosphate cytidylyltransferase